MGSLFQVPSGPACASSGLSRQASLVDTPSVAHFKERLGSMQKGPSEKATVNRTRNFHLIIVQILEAHSHPVSSRPVRPSLAPRGKLVYLRGDRRRTPTKWPAQRFRTAPYECEGRRDPAPALRVLPVDNTTRGKKVRYGFQKGRPINATAIPCILSIPV